MATLTVSHGQRGDAPVEAPTNQLHFLQTGASSQTPCRAQNCVRVDSGAPAADDPVARQAR